MPTAVAFSTWAHALARMDAGHLGVSTYLVPLTAAGDSGAGPHDAASRRDRLAQLCTAYATAGDGVRVDPARVLDVAVTRLHDLADFTAAREAAGAHHVAPHVDLYRRDAAWLREHARELAP